jgi:hypothetical protein
MTEKTHYRKAFNSPYLSAADITEPTVLTIKKVALDLDKTKKTKERFNTAYFVETEIRSGEPLKPMILNAGNSKTLKTLSGSAFIDDWVNLKVTVFVDPSVRFGKDTVEGLRISSLVPEKRKTITPEMPAWANAKAAYIRDGNLKAVLSKVDISQEHQSLLIEECSQKDAA